MSSGKVFMISFIHNGILRKKKVKIPAFPCNVFYSNWRETGSLYLVQGVLGSESFCSSQGLLDH